MNTLRAIALGCCLSIGPCLPAGAVVPVDFAAVDDYVQSQVDQGGIPGLALVIVHGGQVVHVRGFGVADSRNTPVTPQTPFILGSTSKSFTALAVLQLVEAGRIELDAPVQRYLPWFRVADPDASARITLRHLLHQTSGLPASAGYQPIFDVDAGPDALENGVRALRDQELARPVGAGYEYCNANYNILGLVVQTIAGQPYGRYVQEHLFTPLDMQHSFVDLDSANRAGLATGHHQLFGIPVRGGVPFPPGFLPAGFLIASAEDMGHYLIAQLNGGRYGEVSILSAEGMDEMHEPGAKVTPDREIYYDMGWVSRAPNDVPILYHNGDTGDFHTEMALIPDGQWGFAILSNVSHWRLGPRYDFMAGTLAAMLVDRPVQQSGTWPNRIVFAIYAAFFVVTAAQLLGLGFGLRTLQRWRRASSGRPAERRRVRRLALPLGINLVATIALVLAFSQLYAGAAPLPETAFDTPDMAVAVALSVMILLAWLARTAAAARLLRGSEAR